MERAKRSWYPVAQAKAPLGSNSASARIPTIDRLQVEVEVEVELEVELEVVIVAAVRDLHQCSLGMMMMIAGDGGAYYFPILSRRCLTLAAV